MLKTFIATAALALSSVAAQANQVVTYTFTSPATFDDGTQLSGTWAVDFTTDTVLSTNLKTTGGEFPAQSFTNGQFGSFRTFPLNGDGNTYAALDLVNFGQTVNYTLGYAFNISNGVADSAILQSDNYANVLGVTRMTTPGTVTAVPEPETLALMAGGLAFLGGIGRRRLLSSVPV